MKKNNFFLLPKEQQIMVLNQTSPKVGLPPQAIEKDVWVSTILQIVFTLPFADKLIFKGGTSLSKVWGVINPLKPMHRKIAKKLKIPVEVILNHHLSSNIIVYR